MSLGGFFSKYESPTTRQLAQISSSKYPDTNKDFESNMRRVNVFVDYIAQYLQVMQKGVDQANADIITRIRDVFADFVIMLGGGELLYGIDLGDTQYFLAAIGALLGFEQGVPFPINLFNAAEHFLLGYVVPLESFGIVIQDIIIGWATALGLNEEYVAALGETIEALNALSMSLVDIIVDLFQLFDIFGINETGFGIFADIWYVITLILGGSSLSVIGALTDPILGALAPWMHTLADGIDWLNQIIMAFGDGQQVIIDAILNFAAMFSSIDFLAVGFNAADAIVDFIVGIVETAGSFVITNLGPTIDNLVALFGDIVDGGWDIVTSLTDFIGLLITHSIEIPQAIITDLGTALAALLPLNIFGTSLNAGPNMVADPGFENASYWVGAVGTDIAISTEQGYGGSSQSMKITWRTGDGNSKRVWISANGTSSQKAIYDQRWKTVAGKTYVVTGKVYRHASNSSNGNVRISFCIFPSTSTTFDGAPGVTGFFRTFTFAQSTLTLGGWSEITATYTIPTSGGTPYSEFTVSLDVQSNVSDGDAFYFDLGEVREITETQNLFDLINGIASGVVTTGTEAVTAGVGTILSVAEWALNITTQINAQAQSTLADANSFVIDLISTLYDIFVAALGTIPIVGPYVSGSFKDLGNALSTFLGLSVSASVVKPLVGTYAEIMAITPADGQIATVTDRGLTLIGVKTGDDYQWSNGNVTTGPLAELYGKPTTTGQVAFNSATNANVAFDGDEQVLTVTSAAGDNLRGLYWTLASTIGYEKIFYIEYGIVAGNYAHAVAFLSDGTKYITIGICYSTSTKLQVNKWNSATSFNSTVYTTEWPFITGSGYLKVGDNGTKIYFEASINGRDWSRLFEENRGTFLNATRYGYAGFCSNGGSTLVRLRSLADYDDTRTPGMLKLNLTMFRPVITNQTSELILVDGTSSTSKKFNNGINNIRIGDYMVVYAFNGNAAVTPTAPAGWTNMANASGNGTGYRQVYKIATTDGIQDTGVWTNTTLLFIIVYRGGTIGAGNSIAGTKAANGPVELLSVPTFTLDDSSGKSDRIIFAAHNQNSIEQFGAITESGFTKMITISNAGLSLGSVYIKTGVTTSAATSVGLGGPSSTNYRVRNIEIKAV